MKTTTLCRVQGSRFKLSALGCLGLGSGEMVTENMLRMG